MTGTMDQNLYNAGVEGVLRMIMGRAQVCLEDLQVLV